MHIELKAQKALLKGIKFYNNESEGQLFVDYMVPKRYSSQGIKSLYQYIPLCGFCDTNINEIYINSQFMILKPYIKSLENSIVKIPCPWVFFPKFCNSCKEYLQCFNMRKEEISRFTNFTAINTVYDNIGPWPRLF